MASPPPVPPPPPVSPLPLLKYEFEEKIKDAGDKLLKPPSSTEDLLNHLDEIERLLAKVSQEPTHPMLDALQPCMKALIGTEILMHNDIDVKVLVASCISELSRVKAPDAPYGDEEMKKFFQLCIVATEQLFNPCGRSYLRAVSVLKTLGNIRLCVLMLDLELDDLIVKMFKQFLDIKSQPDAAVLDMMEKIMTLVVEESEEPSFELLSVLLSSVKRENENVSPLSWELGKKVLKNCASILVSDIPKAVSSIGIPYTDYAEIVASICQVTQKTDNVDTEKSVSAAICARKVEEDADKQPRSGMNNGGSDTPVNEKSLADCQQIGVASMTNIQSEDINKEAATQQSQKRRGRKPNSLRKEEEGYDNSWIIGISSSLKTPCRGKSPRKRTCNPFNSSALEGTTSPPEPGKEPNSHDLLVKNVHGVSLTSPPSENRSVPEDVHSRHQSGGHQDNFVHNSMSPDNGLNLLSVSAGDLQRTEDKETPQGVSPKTSRGTGDSRGKRKKGSVSTASQSDGKAKRRRVTWKNEVERTGEAANIHREDVISTKADDICRVQEAKRDFPEWQFDAVVQNLERSAPSGNATAQAGDGVRCSGASKVKNKRKRASLPKEQDHAQDHGKEMVGRKIKVWWPEDKEFYRGVITGFDAETKRHKVVYIDDDEENLDLGTEHWECVEDEEDSEATEDTRPSFISSANRFSSAQANSSRPVTVNQKASGVSPKKRTPIHSEQSKPDGAEAGRRTKRRTLRVGKDKNPPAKTQTIAAEPECNDQVVKASSIPVDVGGYTVKAAYAPILASIFAKYGDIAANCVFTPVAARTSLLEVVCDIVKRLKSNAMDVVKSQLGSMETEVRAAEAAKIEVSWLQQYLEKIREAEVGKSSSLLKGMKTNTILAAKAAQRDLAQNLLELAAVQEKVRKSDSCVKALTLVTKHIGDKISVCEAGESAWRKALDELG